jgi:hypothetical protein
MKRDCADSLWPVRLQVRRIRNHRGAAVNLAFCFRYQGEPGATLCVLLTWKTVAVNYRSSWFRAGALPLTAAGLEG